MPYKIAEKVQNWTLEEGPYDFNAIYEQIDYHNIKRYGEYMPTVGPHPDFSRRLSEWLENDCDEREQKLLFRLIPHIFFISISEFSSLYRAALHGPVIRWIIDELGIEFTDTGAKELIKQAISETWFCPITDSMQIAAFYHANNIEGVNLRPDWRSLRHLGSPEKIKKYMEGYGLKRLVLLEDFVGSGSQIQDSVVFAATSIDHCKILLVPLVICPEGVFAGEMLKSQFVNLSFSPLLSLPEEIFITQEKQNQELELFQDIRDLVQRIDTLVKGDNPSNYYGPFGFRSTGGLLVMYTNCPDNTLPIIRHNSNSWNPLFPRSSRI